jgi:hypothetical protein
MTVEAFRQLATADEFHRFLIKTRGGDVYPVNHRESVWLPPDYPRTFCLSMPGKGLIFLDLAAIDVMQNEHEEVPFK